MTKSEIRSCVSALTPAVQAFERAKREGYVMLDEQLGMFCETDLVMPTPPANPDQLALDRI